MTLLLHLHLFINMFFLPNKQRSQDPVRSNLFRTCVSHKDYFKDYLKNSFFPYSVKEWNKLSHELRNSVSIFKKGVLALICPNNQPIFNIVDPIG